MTISNEIYETSLLRVSKLPYEITMNVRFCLSLDFLTYFMAAEVELFLVRKQNIAGQGVMTLRTDNQVLCNINFMPTLSTEK